MWVGVTPLSPPVIQRCMLWAVVPVVCHHCHAGGGCHARSRVITAMWWGCRVRVGCHTSRFASAVVRVGLPCPLSCDRCPYGWGCYARRVLPLFIFYRCLAGGGSYARVGRRVTVCVCHADMCVRCHAHVCEVCHTFRFVSTGMRVTCPLSCNRFPYGWGWYAGVCEEWHVCLFVPAVRQVGAYMPLSCHRC